MTEHEHSRQEAQSHQAQSQEDGEFASPEDFQVSRDGDGNILPQVKDTELGKVKVLPMSYGDVEKHFGESDVADIGPGELAKLLDKHVQQPDLARATERGRLTEEYVQGMKPLAPRELIFAILGASGIDADVEMDDDGGAEINAGN